MKGIVPLEDANDARFGGKASALARAIAAKLPVPEGVALDPEAARAIAEGDAALLRALVSTCRPLRGPFAVRSSALGEDGGQLSFAGQHKTVLAVPLSSLAGAVKEVVDSAAASSGYRRRMKSKAKAEMAVVVQRLIPADAAGVLFTIDPVSGRRERLIEAGFGLGETVVSGRITPDRFRLSPSGKVLERTAGMKDVALRLVRGSLKETAVPARDQGRLSLTDAKLVQLSRVADLCEKELGPKLDLEFAFEGRRLYLLQQRPITTG